MSRSNRGSGRVVVSGNAIIMLLLCGRCSGCSGLLGMLMVTLLMHPCWLAVRVELLLVGENVCPLEHLVRSMLPTSGLAG